MPDVTEKAVSGEIQGPRILEAKFAYVCFLPQLSYDKIQYECSNKAALNQQSVKLHLSFHMHNGVFGDKMR